MNNSYVDKWKNIPIFRRNKNVFFPPKTYIYIANKNHERGVEIYFYRKDLLSLFLSVIVDIVDLRNLYLHTYLRLERSERSREYGNSIKNRSTDR